MLPLTCLPGHTHHHPGWRAGRQRGSPHVSPVEGTPCCASGSAGGKSPGLKLSKAKGKMVHFPKHTEVSAASGAKHEAAGACKSSLGSLAAAWPGAEIPVLRKAIFHPSGCTRSQGPLSYHQKNHSEE